MTEEEKDAIEIYEEDIRIAREYYENEEDFKADGEYNKVILLNLIEKLQKENEELHKEIANDIERENSLKDDLMEIIETLKLENNVVCQETILQEIVRLQEENENCIPKSKIREKIEQLEKAGTTETRNNKNEVVEKHYFLQDEIDVLKELLEEEGE